MSLIKVSKKIHSKGFTLFEIMVVVIVIGVIASLALVGYKNFIRRSECRFAQQHLIKLHSLAQVDRLNGTYTPVFTGPHVNLTSGTTLSIFTPVIDPLRKTANLVYPDLAINCYIYFDQAVSPTNPTCSDPNICEAIIE